MHSVRAFFISPNGEVHPDHVICSGLLPAEFQHGACPYASNGHFPGVLPLNEADANYSIDKGEPGDLCPPCAKQKLGNLGHWQPEGRVLYPEELLPLRLFKCRMWFWLVVPGLHENEPNQIREG